jgi:hypothetical protein
MNSRHHAQTPRRRAKPIARRKAYVHLHGSQLQKVRIYTCRCTDTSLTLLSQVHQAKSKVTSKSSKFIYRSPCNHASTQPASNEEARTTRTKLVGCFPNYLAQPRTTRALSSTYYFSVILHAMCAIKLLHTVRIRVLILGGTSGTLIST